MCIDERRERVCFPLFLDRSGGRSRGVHDRFQPRECLPVGRCDLFDDRPGGVDDARNQPHVERLLGIDDPPGEREIERVAPADGCCESMRSSPRSEQSERDARFRERRGRGCDADVTRKREFQPAAPGRTVDPRDHDGVAGFDGSPDPLAVASERGRRFGGSRLGVGGEIGDDAEIRTGTERRASTAELDDAGVGVGYGRFERIERGGGERVASLRSIERHGSNGLVVSRPYHEFKWGAVSKGLCRLRINHRVMDEAAAVRRAARATVEDIEPARLRDALLAFIDTTSLTPGVLTLLTARIRSDSRDGLEQPAAGVQLIYNGLRLTRQLAHNEPWNDGEEERKKANMHILVADVLVARGFYLLSHTNAASTAVDVVRSFGQHQAQEHKLDPETDGEFEPGTSTAERQLKRDVLELALTTGAVVTDGESATTGDLHAVAKDLAATCEGTGFPAPETFLSQPVTDRLTRSVAGAYVDS